MKRTWHQSPIVIMFLSALTALAVIAMLRQTLPAQSYAYGFIFNYLPIQFVNTWLFTSAIFLTASRFFIFRKEDAVSQSIRVADLDIEEKEAKYLLGQIPEHLKGMVFFRRIREILRAYLYREDVMRLNEELARRDHDQVERGHLLLNSFRQIIPVVGFLGTVIGLSKGMAKFPEISAKAGKIDELKDILRSFSQDLSVAFDTTLLALVYTIVIILLISFLRGKEETHVERINTAARELILKMQQAQEKQESGIHLPDKFLQALQSGNRELVETLNEKLEQGFLNRLETILEKLKS